MKRHFLTTCAAVAAVALACTAAQAQQAPRDQSPPAAAERGGAASERGGAASERRGSDQVPIGQSRGSAAERGTTGQGSSAPAPSRSGPPDEMPPSQKSGQSDTPRSGAGQGSTPDSAAKDAAPKGSQAEQDRGAAKTRQSTDREDRGRAGDRSRDRASDRAGDRDRRDGSRERSTTQRDRSERTGSQQRGRDGREGRTGERTGSDDRQGRDGRGSRDARDSREGRDSRDARDSRDGRDSRSARGRDGSATMSQEQRSEVSTRFSARIDSMNVRPVSRTSIRVSIGASVPRSVTLYDVPRDVVTIYPQYRGHKFVVVEDEIVVIAPGSRRIVATLPRSGGGVTASAPAPRTTGVRQGGMRLSDSQRQTIRTIVLREPRCRTETRIDFVLFVPLPREVEVCEFPPQLVTDLPEMRAYRYVMRGDDIVIVDPREHHVVEVID